MTDLSTPCILAEKGINKQGYSLVWDRGQRRRRGAHRVALEQALGRTLSSKETAGHLCHDAAAHAGLCAGGSSCLHRRCVNPLHLGVQTLAENLAASPLTPSPLVLADRPKLLAALDAEPSPFLSYSEISRAIGVPGGTLRQWRLRGVMPTPDLMDRPPVWSPEAIRAWVESL